MRNPNRIYDFCNELANIWATKCPDWRFGQLMCNIFNGMAIDPFFPEEDEMMDYIKKYFNMDGGKQ